MKAYVLTTGIVFGLLTLAHLARLAAEGMSLLRSPVFVLTTLAAAGLCVWAIVLLRKAPPRGP